jgi:hypothetical protein
LGTGLTVWRIAIIEGITAARRTEPAVALAIGTAADEAGLCFWHRRPPAEDVAFNCICEAAIAHGRASRDAAVGSAGSLPGCRLRASAQARKSFRE